MTRAAGRRPPASACAAGGLGRTPRPALLRCLRRGPGWARCARGQRASRHARLGCACAAACAAHAAAVPRAAAALRARTAGANTGRVPPARPQAACPPPSMPGACLPHAQAVDGMRSGHAPAAHQPRHTANPRERARRVALDGVRRALPTWFGYAAAEASGQHHHECRQSPPPRCRPQAGVVPSALGHCSTTVSTGERGWATARGRFPANERPCHALWRRGAPWRRRGRERSGRSLNAAWCHDCCAHRIL